MCFTGICTLEQDVKVNPSQSWEGQLLQVIIAQKKPGSGAGWSIKEERQQLSQLYTAYTCKLSSLRGSHSRIMCGNPAQGPGANPCAYRGTDITMTQWQTPRTHERTPVSHWGHLNFMRRRVNVSSPPPFYVHTQRTWLTSCTFCPSTHVGSELPSLPLTATNCSKASRGERNLKARKQGEGKRWCMTQKGIRGLFRLKVEAQAPVAGWLASQREISPLMYAALFEWTRCLLASYWFEGQRSP